MRLDEATEKIAQKDPVGSYAKTANSSLSPKRRPGPGFSRPLSGTGQKGFLEILCRFISCQTL
jgi:hypothetical protein